MFKVGDFVIWDRGKYFEVHQIVEKCLVKDHQALSNGSNVHNEDLKPWQPEPDEWCWYLRYPQLVRITEIHSNEINFINYDGKKFNEYTTEMFEPFQGTLPSFTKDN